MLYKHSYVMLHGGGSTIKKRMATTTRCHDDDDDDEVCADEHVQYFLTSFGSKHGLKTNESIAAFVHKNLITQTAVNVDIAALVCCAIAEPEIAIDAIDHARNTGQIAEFREAVLVLARLPTIEEFMTAFTELSLTGPAATRPYFQRLSTSNITFCAPT